MQLTKLQVFIILFLRLGLPFVVLPFSLAYIFMLKKGYIKSAKDLDNQPIERKRKSVI